VSRFRRFRLGQAVATPGALAAIEASDDSLLELLERHVTGDWGVVDAHDARENEDAITVPTFPGYCHK
jgi:hypothetical protein